MIAFMTFIVAISIWQIVFNYRVRRDKDDRDESTSESLALFVMQIISALLSLMVILYLITKMATSNSGLGGYFTDYGDDAIRF